MARAPVQHTEHALLPSLPLLPLSPPFPPCDHRSPPLSPSVVLFCAGSESQLALYGAVLRSKAVTSLLCGGGGAGEDNTLAVITALRKVRDAGLPIVRLLGRRLPPVRGAPSGSRAGACLTWCAMCVCRWKESLLNAPDPLLNATLNHPTPVPVCSRPRWPTTLTCWWGPAQGLRTGRRR